MVADLEEFLEEESLSAAGLPQDTARLRIDLPRKDDVGDVVYLADNRRIAAMLATLPHPFTLADARAMVDRASEGGRERGTFAIRMRSTGRFIGSVGFSPLEPGGPIHLGYWLGEPFWGHGYATEAVQAVIDRVFTATPHETLAAAVRVTNPASKRVLVKCGFQYRDQGMMLSKGAGGVVSVERFGLDRSTWTALKRWGRNS